MKLNCSLIKRNKNKTEQLKKKKLNYIDKLFIRIFLSSILILSLVTIDRLKNNHISLLFNDNINFLKIAKIFNGDFGNFVNSKFDEHVYSVNIYDEVLYDKKTELNLVYNYSFDGVYNLENGIVTKIKRKDNGYYDITIKGYDGFNYTYCDLESIDFHIYNYVSNEAIIGVAPYDEKTKCYVFKVIIEKEGVKYDYYQNAEN